MDEKTYKKYKQRIREAVAAVDNRPPRLDVSYYYKKRNLTIDANRIREIDRENMDLLKRISIISRTGGKVDCWMTSIKYKTNLEDQEPINRHIMKKNKNLLKRIREASSNYPTGEFIKNWKEMNKKVMHTRRNTPFHRIVSGYWCKGGDVTKFDGSGGASVFDNPFENENFNLRHAGPGILSMYNDKDNRNDSKFNLTFRRLETMDGKFVVFGKVVSGLSNIYKIEEFGTKTGKPIKTVIISNCGIISRKHEYHSSKDYK
ncbi:PREDICTED: peptidyl-prolyl cis-trans isomerase CYP18-3-like [Dufourea novaeangliae]|uniref:peptidyl-prolyl cis-trans isomerase CYP18-3-like n=1 Tax=Dufourea novaeangliae TaxID=178035 RepID=UPI0007670B33|nr:PREDICTED: peptidyl-prolyl cis-trans isomerase CYP18-3-like [Dufourea novaeangliae]